MSKSNLLHNTFDIAHVYPVPPAKVYAAFADDELKKKWAFMDPAMATTERYENDFRVGGKETSRFRMIVTSPGGSPVGTIMGGDAVYMDIVENQRIVWTYTMLVNDTRMSTSLATLELLAEGSGTRLLYNEQAVYYDKEKGSFMQPLRIKGLTHVYGKIGQLIA